MIGASVTGRVTVEAKIENAIEAALAHQGKLPASAVRTVVVSDALIDTGATTLGLPVAMLRQPGLDTPVKSKRSRNTTGEYEVKIYGPVRLWIFDRDMILDAMEVADGCPVLIGQLPLEHMQLVVDMANHRIAKSPANGGEWILDMF